MQSQSLMANRPKGVVLRHTFVLQEAAHTCCRSVSIVPVVFHRDWRLETKGASHFSHSFILKESSSFHIKVCAQYACRVSQRLETKGHMDYHASAIQTSRKTAVHAF